MEDLQKMKRIIITSARKAYWQDAISWLERFASFDVNCALKSPDRIVIWYSWYGTEAVGQVEQKAANGSLALVGLG